CVREVRKLAKVDNGWQFSALHAKAEQIECFRIEEMTTEIEAEAPVLWGLFDAVLSAGRVRTTTSTERQDVSKEWEAEESEYWCQELPEIMYREQNGLSFVETQ
ncbi:uncharacterized protein BJ212DRAFT_1332695, partial [Suillus subaureus]